MSAAAAATNTESNNDDNLQQAVQSTLSTLLQNRLTDNCDIAQDVYRSMRDAAHLLLERQLTCDALDTDPFELMKIEVAENSGSEGDDDGDANTEDQECDGNGEEDDDLLEKKKNREVIARAKVSGLFVRLAFPMSYPNEKCQLSNYKYLVAYVLVTSFLQDLLKVISCTRTTTPEGYSSVQAVVQLDNDGKMQGVKDNVRLHFTFLREPQHDTAPSASDNGDGDGVNDDKGSTDKAEEESDAKMDNENTKAIDKQPPKKRKRTSKDDASTNGKGDETDDEISGSGESGSGNNNGQANNSFSPKTIVTYKIEYSVDYGKMEQLLGVDIYALGGYPSVEEAIPMVDGEDEDGQDDDDAMGGCDDDDEAKKAVDGKDDGSNGKTSPKRQNAKESSSSNSDAEFEEIEMSSSDDNGNEEEADQNVVESGKGDRFGVYVNPQNIVSFVDRTNMNFNERSIFYFLMTFPFYEHEWDICGFLLSALFDDDDESEMEEDEENNRGGMMMMMDGCPVECPGGQPCCMPCN